MRFILAVAAATILFPAGGDASIDRGIQAASPRTAAMDSAAGKTAANLKRKRPPRAYAGSNPTQAAREQSKTKKSKPKK